MRQYFHRDRLKRLKKLYFHFLVSNHWLVRIVRRVSFYFLVLSATITFLCIVAGIGDAIHLQGGWFIAYWITIVFAAITILYAGLFGRR